MNEPLVVVGSILALGFWVICLLILGKYAYDFIKGITK